MKKVIAIALSVGMLAGAYSLPAEAKKKKKKRIERVVEITYTHPGIGAATPAGGTGYPANFPEGSSEIPLGPDDLFMKVEVVDDSGQAVSGFISQGDIDGNGVNDDGYGTFCGAHAEPIPVASPGAPIIGIYAHSGVCADGTPSIMTSGTIKVTLSNMP